jgi:hypothetical protein
MLQCSFMLTNPFIKRFDVKTRVIRISEYKTLDLNLTKDNNIISFYLRWAIRESHAGICVDVGILGYSIGFEFADVRHWDSQKGTWME